MKQFYVDIPVRSPLSYNLTGKFVAPSPEWKHADFDLRDFELIMMTEGTLYLEYRDIRYTVKEGEYLLLLPHDPPDNRRRGFQPSDCSFYWLHFLAFPPIRSYEPSCMEQAPLTLPDYYIRLPLQGRVSNPEKLLVLLRQLQNDVRLSYPKLALDYETTTILCELFSQSLDKGEKESSEQMQKQIFSDIVDYVRMNTAVNLKVSDVAKQFGYNEKYLSHLFTRIAGIPLKQFILRCKMEEANFLLADTNLSISEIAYRLGYTDSHNFTRTYKKASGVSPSSYRKVYAQRLLFHV